jgi:hypothetical protein
MADVLSEEDTPVADQERAERLALNQDMGMGDRVPNVLATCCRISTRSASGTSRRTDR